MKKYFYLFTVFFSLLFIFNSCSNDPINEMEEAQPSLRSATSTNPSIEFFTPEWRPVWRWYHYNHYKKTDNDHYFGSISPAYSTTTQIKGKNYSYENQPFWVMTDNLHFTGWQNSYIPLYLFYSPTEKAHRLHTSPTLSGFQQEAFLGYIYSTQQMGTVPLKEYFYDPEKDYCYYTLPREEEWVRQNMPASRYMRTLGYVFNGENSENEAEREKITVKINQYSKLVQPHRFIVGELDVYAKEKNSNVIREYYFTLYSHDLYNGVLTLLDWKKINGEFVISIPEDCSIIDFDIYLVANNTLSFGVKNIINDLPFYRSGSFNRLNDRWSMELRKTANKRYLLDISLFAN
ncbi:MAG: hypothetical protein LIO93_05415 [Bacteroidales bacterium]|nr:hypothetical protein [Bacteroidales bacterium]